MKTAKFSVRLIEGILTYVCTSILVYFLWNLVVTQVCGFHEATILQAFGLFLLCQILKDGFKITLKYSDGN